MILLTGLAVLAVQVARICSLLVADSMYHQTMILPGLAARIAQIYSHLVQAARYHRIRMPLGLAARIVQIYSHLVQAVMYHRTTMFPGLAAPVVQTDFLPAEAVVRTDPQVAAPVTAAPRSRRYFLLAVVSLRRRTGSHSVAAVRFAQRYFPLIEVASFVQKHFLRRKGLWTQARSSCWRNQNRSRKGCQRCWTLE